MLSRLDRLAYRSQHLSWLVNATVMQEAARLFTRTPRPVVSAAEVKALLRRRDELHARDLANVEAGYYPRELLFDFPIRQYARAFPRLVRDTPRVVRRMKQGNYHDIPAVDKERYPAYYRRNFHWQTDGYFSEHSAEVYELGVELLFRGTADVMRRQIIPPITRHVRASAGARQLRLLDVACGTGRTLHQIARTHPTMRLWGVDLSPAYVRIARKRLGDVAELALAVENGEALPFADGTFDIATSVYLFHELPRNARRNVVRELHRVVRPGGIVVIEDSAQAAESPEIATALREFPREFHEPFYADYLEDDLAGILREVGFAVMAIEPHLVAKVVVARRH
ncbi:MAG: class I SAM-dependent methyltransferase [Deltaproteobacteria bacterium]|nr:class I SAM-dependent methyltransferase [Deltaproteobacteria bacterium]MDQ3298413.1 class I SAM-dependent methyltransferase [Myxococcota bacterium]